MNTYQTIFFSSERLYVLACLAKSDSFFFQKKKKIDALNRNGYVALALIAPLRKSFNFQASVFQNFYIAEVGFILQRMK